MRVLVTGGAGFIGANFTRWLLETHPEDHVTVLDALTYAGCRESLPPESSRFHFVHGDIRDAAAVAEAARGADMIVHFAAESHVDRSISGPGEFLRTNVLGTFHLLEHARREGIRFHHISTDEVYGSLGPDDPAFREDTPYAPNSPYSASKAASDHLVRAYVHTYGLQATISNCSNNYGPYHFPEKLIPLCLTNALRGLPLPVYGDGGNVRDWLYVEDHADALRFHKRIVHHGHGGEHLQVPYYQQSTGFTCGSAALMMAMSALRPSFVADQRTEFQIWREATTIFMTSGHGGCGPHGLAYAAAKREFDVDVYVNQPGPLFVEGVRDPVKKQVLELVHQDFVAKLKDSRVEVFNDHLFEGRDRSRSDHGFVRALLRLRLPELPAAA